MLFSVIVPIYNVEKYLRECVDSILSQSFSDFELVLVDDGSLDGCPAICDEYAAADSRVKVIHKQNGGLVSARKAGAEQASGEYICCVDSDDYLDKDYLAGFAGIIAEYGADIVTGGSVWVYKDFSEMHTPRAGAGFYSFEEKNTKIMPVLLEDTGLLSFNSNIWGSAIRAEIYRKVQASVDDRIRMGEDGACFKPCLFLARSLYVSDKCLYYYRQQTQSMSKASKPRAFEDTKLVCAALDRWIDFSEGDLAAQRDRYIVHSLFNICVSQFNRDDKQSEIKRDIRAQLNDPFFRDAVKRVKFSARKGKIMKFALKHKLMFILRMAHNCLEKNKRRTMQ